MPTFPSSGGVVEAFSYEVDFTTTAISNDPLTLVAGSGTFWTPGVSMASSAISIPAGLWLIGANLKLIGFSGTGIPTIGDVSIGAVPYSSVLPDPVYLGWLHWQEIDWTGNPPIISGSNLHNVTASTDTLTVFSYTDMDVTLRIRGSVWGHQVSSKTLTVGV